MDAPKLLGIDLGGSIESDNAPAWIHHAEAFGRVARSVFSSSDLVISLVLFGYAIELALKGLLLERKDATLQDVKSLRHNLPAILARAINAGLPPDLISMDDARQLAMLFDKLPSAKRPGIYPTQAVRQSVEVDSRFPLLVAQLIEYCATQVCGPRDAAEEARQRAQLLEMHGPLAIRGEIICRRKPLGESSP